MIAILQFIKKPHVLNRDHRLVGEGFEKSDLVLRDRPDFSAMQGDCANQIVLFEEWHSDVRPHPFLSIRLRHNALGSASMSKIWTGRFTSPTRRNALSR